MNRFVEIFRAENRRGRLPSAGLETGDTADLEICATSDDRFTMKFSP
jgi:hypothetical protein